MSKAIFLDTLFFVALVNDRDQYHDRADAFPPGLSGRQFLTTDAVLLGIGNSLARAFKTRAIEIIDYLLTSDDVKVVRLTPTLFDEGFALYRKHRDKEWGLVDCISFVVMRQAGVVEALTFDQYFGASWPPGVDAGVTYRFQGRDFRLTDVHGRVVREILA